MAIHISQPKPLLCIRHTRFKSDKSWRLSDVCVSETDVIAVSGYHSYTERTFIDLYNNFADSKSRQIVSSMEFEPHVGLKSRFVCFLDEDDTVVTCIGDQVKIIAPRENKTLQHGALHGNGIVEYLTTWNGNIFTAYNNSNTVHEYDRKLHLVNVIHLKGIPRGESWVDISFSFDAYFVCTTERRAMKLSTKDGLALYEFDDGTTQSAYRLTVSDRWGVAFILWRWNEIRVYSIDDISPILIFNVDNNVHKIRMSDRGTFVTGCHYTGDVKVYNVEKLLSYDQWKQSVSSLLSKDNCVKLANYLEVNLNLESRTDSTGKLLFDVLESKGIVDQHNVERLSKALFELEMKSPYGDITDLFQKLRPPSIKQPQMLSTTPSADEECSASVTSSKTDPRTKRTQTDTYDSKNDMATKKKQKILRTASISQEENQPQMSTENIFLKAEATIGQSGGTIGISNTQVKLHIPPNALPEEVDNCVIQLRIIPQKMLKENVGATFWNTPTVVELLPNNLQLREHVKLTFPHGFVLKGPRPSAKVLVSHQEQGNIPFWEEEADCDYMVETTTCIVRLKRFCWVRLRINDNEILAKKLVLYTAGKRPLPNCNKFTVIVGYYPDLPGEGKFIQLNPSVIVSERKYFNYYKERENPLRLSLTETVPETWKLCVPKENIEEIKFETISSSIEYSRPFTFQNKGKRNELPILHFKASQEEGMQPVEITINLEELRDHSPQPIIGPSDSMKSTCWELSEKISGEWKTVGRNLNISDAQLHQIKIDNAGNIKEAIYAMFLHWLQHAGTSATRLTLSSALKDAGRSDLASELDKQLL